MGRAARLPHSRCNPVEGNWGPAIAAEGALVPAVVVTVTVTVAVAPGRLGAPGTTVVPAVDVAAPGEASDVGVGGTSGNVAASGGVTVGENTAGVVGDAPGEVAR
jgi:hypothetical protein